MIALKPKSLPTICAPVHQNMAHWKSGVPNEEYHADLASLSRSGIVTARRSPAHFLTKWGAPSESSPALLIGSATDLAVFDRDEYKKLVVVQPEFGRKDVDKAAKAKWLASLPPGSIVLDEDEKAIVDAMAESVLAHPLVRGMLSDPDGASQLSGYWVDKETGILCRCRPDWRTGKPVGGGRLLADLKTARDASKPAFARAVIKHGYDIQAAHYLDGAEAIDGEPYEGWAFIVVEKSPPFPCVVYVADEAMLAHGRAERSRVMRQLAQCISTNTWPAYGSEAQTLSLPTWALTSAEDFAL